MQKLPHAVATAFVLVACGSDPPPPAVAPTGPVPPAATMEPTRPEKAGDVPSRSNINISEDIRKACGITQSEV